MTIACDLVYAVSECRGAVRDGLAVSTRSPAGNLDVEEAAVTISPPVEDVAAVAGIAGAELEDILAGLYAHEV